EGIFPPGFSNDLNDAWKSKQTRLDLYVNDFYLSLIHKATPSGLEGLRRRLKFLPQKLIQEEQERELKSAQKELQAITDRFLTSLRDYRARLLTIVKTEKGSFSEPAQFLSHLLNLEDRPLLMPDMDLASYLSSKRLFFGKDALEARGMTSSTLAAILSVKEYADSTIPGLLDRFL